MDSDLSRYKPDFPTETWSGQDRFFLEPFAPGLDGFVSTLTNLPPELVGALCSRASRAKNSLLRILLDEYFYPIINGDDTKLASELKETVTFLRTHGFKNIVNNQRAQAFYAKWLSQYGDDSIAQMTGTHLVFWGISQVAMKIIEDRRIGLEPIEKSTRYVNFANKVGGRYLYYIPQPDLERLGLLSEYRATLDNLFDTYTSLLPKLMEWLKANFNEKESILEKKAFDTLRGLLPMATLGQVAFRGNAQAFEYLLNQTAKHPLGELRWLSQTIKTQLDKEIPSLLLRINDEKSQQYQDYLAGRGERVRSWLTGNLKKTMKENWTVPGTKPEVRLVEATPDAEEVIVAGIIYPTLHISWEKAQLLAKGLSEADRAALIAAYIGNRTARWQKVGRAFENAYLRYDITMNIGAYRDLHRHRMMTQERQLFSTHHGFDLPLEIQESGLRAPFEAALLKAKVLFEKIEAQDPDLAQYVVPLAYRIRFYQWQNVRQLFWESELRTISQGHPDYRFIEQEKYRLFKVRFPQLAKHLLVDLNDYVIARRGTEELIAKKEKEIMDRLKQRQENGLA